MEGDGWSAAPSDRFTLGKYTAPYADEAVSASEPVSTARKVFPLRGFDSRTVDTIASRYPNFIDQTDIQNWKCLHDRLHRLSEK
jgi:hypothetical protein